MSIINPLAREISAKIVYYGPGLSGKTTTLRYIYSAVKPERRGELVTLATEGDRTLFFDFLPITIDRVQDMPVRLQLYTVPGQVFYGATRKLVLNGADGVVFVADSQEAARDSNRQSLDDLMESLLEMGIPLGKFPHVFQYNKRDLKNITPVATLNAELNRFGAPYFASNAMMGVGLLETLKEIAQMVIRDLKGRLSVSKTRATRDMPVVDGDDGGFAAQVAAAAERTPTPVAPVAAPETVVETSGLWGISFAPLWSAPDTLPTHPGAKWIVADVEASLRERNWPKAARTAASALAQLLDSLPGATAGDGPMSKAMLLGLDGHEYLRLCKLASAPEAAVSEMDAFFALYLLVAARIKSLSI